MSRPSVAVDDNSRARCAWSGTDAEYRRYHDEEWSVPLHGDAQLFEKLSLEGFQAGLSWITILRRRPAFRTAFHGFDIATVAVMSEAEREGLMNDSGIIRNRAKIEATVSNAAIVLEMVTREPGAFDRLMWSFAPQPRARRPLSLDELPTVTPESTAMSAALRKLGLKFVGPTTMYALMQSTGMVDDHVDGCWRATEAA